MPGFVCSTDGLHVGLVVDAAPVVTIQEEGGVSSYIVELGGHFSMVDVRSIIPGVCETVVALGDYGGEITTSGLEGGCTGNCSGQECSENSLENHT